MTSLVHAAEHGATHHLPFPPMVFGILTLVFFALCLGILFSFRNSAPLDRTVSHDHGHGGHGELTRDH